MFHLIPPTNGRAGDVVCTSLPPCYSATMCLVPAGVVLADQLSWGPTTSPPLMIHHQDSGTSAKILFTVLLLLFSMTLKRFPLVGRCWFIHLPAIHPTDSTL